MVERGKNMLERLNIILNSVIGSSIGVFIAHSIYKYFDYTKHPDLYEIQSVPWYTSIQIYGLVVALIVFIAIIIKLLIKKKMRDV
nr:hypothetical protein [Tissierella carlieri]